MEIIDKELLDKITAKAVSVPRKRKNYNFHQLPSDPMNRMLNAFEPATYVRPHKHENPDKREVFILLQGRLAMMCFDNIGNVTDSVILDHATGNFGVEIPPGEWHTVVSLQTGTVVYELKDGPYNPDDDKYFAPWAPQEESDEAQQYLEKLLLMLGSKK
jgi:cupin fold WbuC family metalloprotein